MRSVRVLHVNTQYRLGGAETVMHQLLRGFPDSRAAIADGREFPPDVIPLYPRALARLWHSRLHAWVERLAPRAKWTEAAFRRLACSAFDLIHIHNFHGRYAEVKALAELVRAKPLVWTFHALWGVTGGCDHPRDCLGYRQRCQSCPALSRWPLQPSDDTAAALAEKLTWLAPLPLHVIAPSQWLAEMVRQSPVGRNWRVHHVPNAVDSRFLAAVSRRPRTGSAIGVVCRDFDDVQKGGAMIHAALMLVPVELRRPLILVGRHSDRLASRLEGWRCEAMDYQASVEDLASIFGRLEILLFASPAENFPCVVLEGMAAGLCVVATPSGGVVEQILDGECGVLASAIDGVSLGEALIRVLQNDALRARAGVQARTRVAERYQEQHFLERHQQIYAEVIASWRRTR